MQCFALPKNVSERSQILCFITSLWHMANPSEFLLQHAMMRALRTLNYSCAEQKTFAQMMEIYEIEDLYEDEKNID